MSGWRALMKYLTALPPSPALPRFETSTPRVRARGVAMRRRYDRHGLPESGRIGPGFLNVIVKAYRSRRLPPDAHHIVLEPGQDQRLDQVALGLAFHDGGDAEATERLRRQVDGRLGLRLDFGSRRLLDLTTCRLGDLAG